jgi:hypothetical protein
LEDVVIRAVDDQHVHRRVLQRASSVETSEAAADDQYSWHFPGSEWPVDVRLACNSGTEASRGLIARGRMLASHVGAKRAQQMPFVARICNGDMEI